MGASYSVRRPICCTKSAARMWVTASGLVLDLSRVSHIDSCGVGAVVGLMVSVRNRGGDLRMVHPSTKVKQVLKLTHILELLQVFDSEDAAVRQLRRPENEARGLAGVRLQRP